MNLTTGTLFSYLPITRKGLAFTLFIANFPELGKDLHVSLVDRKQAFSVISKISSKYDEMPSMSISFQYWLIHHKCLNPLLWQFDQLMRSDHGDLGKVFLRLSEVQEKCQKQLSCILERITKNFDFNAIQLVDHLFGDGVCQIRGEKLVRIEWIRFPGDHYILGSRVGTYALFLHTQSGQYLLNIGSIDSYFEFLLTLLSNTGLSVCRRMVTPWDKKFLSDLLRYHNLNLDTLPIGPDPEPQLIPVDHSVFFIPN